MREGWSGGSGGCQLCLGVAEKPFSLVCPFSLAFLWFPSVFFFLLLLFPSPPLLSPPFFFAEGLRDALVVITCRFLSSHKWERESVQA